MKSAVLQSLRLRPGEPDDAEAFAALVNACALEWESATQATAQHVRGQMQTPGFNLASDSLVAVGPGEQLVGYAIVQDLAPHTMIFVMADVHPQLRGQGIGTALCHWAEQRGRRSLPLAPSGERVVLVQKRSSRNEPARELLLGQGYHAVRHNFCMMIELQEPPLPPEVPPDITIRPFVRDREGHALVEALREAFRGSWGYLERPFEDEYRRWMHLLDRDADNDPSPFWSIGLNGEEIAGMCLGNRWKGADRETAWIHVLGVRPSWRRRGLALALLLYTFGALYRQGSSRIGLEVDTLNPTGATRLYQKAGMHVDRRFDFFEKELRPGRDAIHS